MMRRVSQSFDLFGALDRALTLKNQAEDSAARAIRRFAEMETECEESNKHRDLTAKRNQELQSEVDSLAAEENHKHELMIEACDERDALRAQVAAFPAFVNCHYCGEEMEIPSMHFPAPVIADDQILAAYHADSRVGFFPVEWTK